MKSSLINLSLLLLLALPARADVLVAVASNFTAPAQAIAAAFEQQTPR